MATMTTMTTMSLRGYARHRGVALSAVQSVLSVSLHDNAQP